MGTRRKGEGNDREDGVRVRGVHNREREDEVDGRETRYECWERRMSVQERQ